jgi:replicative DNA helicase
LEKYLKQISHGAEFQLSYIPRINKVLNGLERKKLVVIGARPSEGKSTFALQMAYELSLKFKVLYLSLEMTVEESMMRLFCYHMKMQNLDIYNGRYFDLNNKIEEFKEELRQKDRLLVVGEEMGMTWEEVDLILETFGEDKPDIVFLDYIQCIRTNGKKLEAMEDYIKKFRKCAIDKNFCLCALSQINRQNVADNKEPTMEGLKNTGFLEEHADKVILLHYPHKKSPNIDQSIFKVIVAKNKNGMTAFVNCCIDPGIYKIYEAEEEKPKQMENWQE